MPASRPEVSGPDAAPRVLVVGCGALARELVTLTRHLPNVTLTCLPATLHNRPGGIPEAVRQRIRRRRAGFDRVFVAYADCGTGGLLDPVVERLGATRLPGAHCYEVFAGAATFAALADAEPGTFYLTDYLARHFDALVVAGLGLDTHPELRDTYFAHYHRLVLLAQSDDPDVEARARRAAETLRLEFTRVRVGLGPFATAVHAGVT